MGNWATRTSCGQSNQELLLIVVGSDGRAEAERVVIARMTRCANEMARLCCWTTDSIVRFLAEARKD